MRLNLKLLFSGAIVLLVFLSLAVGLKLLIRLIPDWGEEIIGLINTGIFFIVGIGFGLVFEKYIPTILIFLFVVIISVPLFMLNPYVDYVKWINHYSTSEQISREQSKQIIDKYLLKQIGTTGLVGYYKYAHNYEMNANPVQKRALWKRNLSWILSGGYFVLSLVIAFGVY